MVSGFWVALAVVLVADPVDDLFTDLQSRGGCIRHAPTTTVGRLVGIRDLPDIRGVSNDLPTTALLANRRSPSPERRLPGGLRITTRCDHGCCVDGLMAGDKVLFASRLDAEDRRTCQQGWVDRVVRVAFQDETAVSIYIAQSWYADGAAHANNRLRCRTFDRATGKPLRLGDVLPGNAASRALERARQSLHAGEHQEFDVRGFALDPNGIRFRRGKSGGRDVQFCAEGPYPSSSDHIVELDAR